MSVILSTDLKDKSAVLPPAFLRFSCGVDETVNELEKMRIEVEALDLSFTGDEEARKVFEIGVTEEYKNRLLEYLLPRFGQCEPLLNELMPHLRRNAVAYFTSRVGRYFHECPFGYRAFHKPSGYAGDYEMMNLIYRNGAEGNTLFRRCLNLYSLSVPYSVAVRNRAELLTTKLQAKVENLGEGKTLKVLSVASGPAREVCRLIEKNHPYLSRVEFVLLDQDFAALEFAKSEIDKCIKRTGSAVSVRYVAANAIHYVRRRDEDRFDFIYSAGLFDYFTDSLARLTAQRLFQKLTPQGELFIGNYKSYSAGRMQMEMVLDWHLTYRDENELMQLFSQITPNLSLESENERVNLFVTLRNL